MPLRLWEKENGEYEQTKMKACSLSGPHCLTVTVIILDCALTIDMQEARW